MVIVMNMIMTIILILILKITIALRHCSVDPVPM